MKFRVFSQIRLLSILLLLLGLTACDSGSSGGSPASVAGTWQGTGAYEQNNVPITDFRLELTQTGNAITGTYSVTRVARATMVGRVNGVVDGNKVRLPDLGGDFGGISGK